MPGMRLRIHLLPGRNRVPHQGRLAWRDEGSRAAPGTIRIDGRRDGERRPRAAGLRLDASAGATDRAGAAHALRAAGASAGRRARLAAVVVRRHAGGHRAGRGRRRERRGAARVLLRCRPQPGQAAAGRRARQGRAEPAPQRRPSAARGGAGGRARAHRRWRCSARPRSASTCSRAACRRRGSARRRPPRWRRSRCAWSPHRADRRGYGRRFTAVRMPRRISSGGGGQPGTVDVDRDHVGDAAAAGVALAEDAAVAAAVADRDHQPRLGRGVVGAAQRLLHVARHRPGDQQHVGVARAGDEPDAQALDVVVGVVERVDLQLAAVARAGIDLADRQRLAEDGQQFVAGCAAPRRARRRRRAAAARCRCRCGRSGGGSSTSEVVSRVAEVERLVDEREVRERCCRSPRARAPASSATTGRGSGSAGCGRRRPAPAPRAPRRASLRPSRRRSAALPGSCTCGARTAPSGRSRAELADQAQRLEDLVEAHRHARRDVAVAAASPCVTCQRVVGRPGVVAAQVGGLAAGAAGQAGQPELRGQLGRDAAGGHEAVLQAGVLVVDRGAACAPRARSRRTGARMRVAQRRGRGRRRRRRAPRSPSSGGGRRPRCDRRSQSSRRRENCARPKASAASLPSAPRSPRWLATRSRSSISARSQLGALGHRRSRRPTRAPCSRPRRRPPSSRPTRGRPAGAPAAARSSVKRRSMPLCV